MRQILAFRTPPKPTRVVNDVESSDPSDCMYDRACVFAVGARRASVRVSSSARRYPEAHRAESTRDALFIASANRPRVSSVPTSRDEMTPSSAASGTSRSFATSVDWCDRRRRRRRRRDVRVDSQQSRQKKGRGGKRANGGSATELDPASLVGVEENHNLEQFFYDDATTKRLLTIARRYERPVFMCNPSLAAAWEREVGTEYVLLDCDVRFKKLLKGFKAFNLRGPFFLLRFDYDVVFCDPPFANVSPAQVKTAIDMIAGTEKQKAADVYLAYNSDREEALLESFTHLARMGRALGYKSVKEGMQEKIHLYGPKI